MAGPFEVSRNAVVINASAHHVFNYLADMTLHGEWNQDPGFEVTARPDLPAGAGSVFRRERNGVMRGPLIIRGGMSDNPVQIVKTMTITAFEPHNDLVFETRNSYNGLLVSIDKVSFNLLQEMEGTRVTMVSQVEAMVPSAYIGPVYAIRMVRAVLQRLLGGWLKSVSPSSPVGPHLARIKKAVETGETAGDL